MYNKINVIIAILALCLVASCKNKKVDDSQRQSEFIKPASMNYSHEDTMRINQLMEDYVAGFAAKDYDRTANMLYKVVNDTVYPFSEKEKENYKKA